MNVLYRNFLREISADAFGEKAVLEPLSPFKERKLENLHRVLLKTSASDEAAPLFANKTLLKRYNTICAIPDYVGTPTLHLLKLIVKAMQSLMNHGLRIPHVVNIGKALRTEGHLVDFVTLQEWLQRLHIQRVASLLGDILVELFNFGPEEIPFLIYVRDKLTDKVISDIFAATGKRQVTKYFPLYPQEVASGFVMRLKHRIDEVEE